jgi:hypothetical protein
VDKTWEVDDANTVVAHFGAFGGKTVKVNGKEVFNSRKLGPKGTIPFALRDGRPALITVQGQFVGAPAVDLKVGDNLVVETGKAPIKCPACETVAKPYDRFCSSCGQAMPSAEDYRNTKLLKGATRAITILAVLFLLVGVGMYFVTKGQATAALAQMQDMDPGATFPKQVQGKSYTVGELRRQLAWEPRGVLLVNLIIAAIMGALAFWSRRSPLPAVIIATATYVVVIVAGAIVDPATLGQGLILKIIIISLLVKGIKAALALRAANA